MGLGEFFIFFFITAILTGGVIVGYRLYKWNMKDHLKRKERNEQIKNNK